MHIRKAPEISGAFLYESMLILRFFLRFFLLPICSIF